jgi:formylmethanofuran dehydrogenase subunit B
MKTSVENAVCTFCGCLCDDITVEVEDGKIVKAKHACANGRGTFLDYDPAPKKPKISGKEVSWDQAIAECARILTKADSPLIYGLSSTAVEAQTKAVELADKIGAMIDTTSSVCHGPTGLAMQTVGEATCTLGEVRDRSDLVICWGCNPSEAHMRHFARYSLMPKSKHLPRGRKDRTFYVVDVRPTKSSKNSDHFIQVKPGSDYEILTTLRALVRGKNIDVREVGGVPIEDLIHLAHAMKSCSFGAVLMGMGLTMTRGRDLCVSELFSLVADLNEFTRFSVLPMRGHSNVAGADQVMTWQTGYPFAVNFAKGYPQYGPGEFTAVDVLAKKEADAAVIISSDPGAHFPWEAAKALEEIPTIVLDPEENLTAKKARVFLPTACYGIDASGTYYRLDNLSIRAQQILPTVRPTDKEVLVKIMEEMHL